MKKIFLILSLLFLAVLGGLIGYIEFFSVPMKSFSTPLAEAVPARLEGWEIQDVPLAQTQGSLEHVNNVLLFDDSVQRLYRKGSLELIVYVAYWTPGKVTTSDAGTHNPDSCWVLAGWTRHEREYSVPTEAAGKKFLPCEYGVYSYNNRKSYVEFWHLVNGVPNRYESQQTGWRTGIVGRIERFPLVIEDMRKFGINMKREQMFVRISANRPYSEFRNDPDYINLLTRLEKLGLVQNEGWGANAASPKDERRETMDKGEIR